MLSTQNHQLSKARVFELVRRYLLLVVAVTVIGAVTMWALLPIAFTEAYESQVKLLVKIGRENAETPTTVQRGQVLSQGVRLADINSEIEILSSRSLLEVAIDRIGLAAFRPVLPEPKTQWEYPKYYAKKTAREAKRIWNEFLIGVSVKKRLSEREDVLIGLTRGVTVEPIRDSDILVLKVNTPAPELSVSVARILVDEYLKRRMDIRRTSAGAEFFLARMTEAQESMDSALRLRSFVRQEWDLSAPSEQRTQYLNQFDILQKEIVQNEAELTRLRQEVTMMSARRESLPEEVHKQQVEAQNPSLGPINDRLTSLLVERARIGTRYTPTSDAMKKIETEIKELQDALGSVKQTVVSEITTETNPTRRQFDNDIETTAVRIEGLVRRNAYLRGPESDLRTRIREMSKGFDAYESADREFKMSEQNYLNFSQRYREAKMSEELDTRRIANVVPVDQPEIPIQPSAPNKIFIMEIAIAAALFLGIGLAVVLETTEDRIFGERNVLAMNNVPYLGSVKVTRIA